MFEGRKAPQVTSLLFFFPKINMGGRRENSPDEAEEEEEEEEGNRMAIIEEY